jgi:hypothetical protein
MIKHHLSEYRSHKVFDFFTDVGYIVTIPTEQRHNDIIDITIQAVQEMMSECGHNPENIKVVSAKFNHNKTSLCVPHHAFDYCLHAYECRNGTKFNTVWNSSGDQVLYMPGKPTAHRLNVLSEFIKQDQLQNLKYSLLKPSGPLWTEFYESNYLRLFPEQTKADAENFMEKYTRTLDVTQLERQSHTRIDKYHNTDMDIYHKGAVVVSQQIDTSVYQNVYMRLVSETGCGFQTTEKTWTPIMDRVPFFLTNGTYQYIVDKGFLTYNNFVKPGLAEAAIDNPVLLPELVNEFRNVCEVRHQEIQEIIDHNFHQFQSYVTRQQEELKKYLTSDINYEELKPYILGLYG